MKIAVVAAAMEEPSLAQQTFHILQLNGQCQSGTKNAYPKPITSTTHRMVVCSCEQRKNPPTSPTFHYTGWLIGILIMAYYNPYITA